MKKYISWMLCLAMVLALALPALADEEPAAVETEAGSGEEQSMDADLSALTLQVKETLDIDDDYTDFSSDYYDGPSPLWSLYWSDTDRQLSVEVRADGTVVNMYRWESRDRGENFYGFDPAFPPISQEEAQAQAEAWCEKLFTGAESGRLDETRIYLGSEGYYHFYGTVLKNGLESPVSFDMVIDGTGMSSFYRHDQADYVGELPAPDEGDEAAAEAALAGAVELELRWVSDGDGTARLMYVPVGARTVVDARTGEAVDMDALYEDLDKSGAYYGNTMDGAAQEVAAMDTGRGASLTETEISSIENYADVLDQTALDEALRAYEALGLDGFELVRCSYAMDSETGDVTASVRYSGTMTADRLYGYAKDAFDEAQAQGQDMTIYKYITMDAKTGALKELTTGYPIWEREGDEPGLDVQAEVAVPFAEQVLPELAEQTAGCTLKGYDERDSVVLARMQDGYFYPSDRIEVHVDPASGVVDQFWYTWDEDLAFGPADDIIDADEALEAYTGALDVTLGYVAWPIDVTDEPDGPYADWLRWGASYVEELRLAYYLSGTDDVQGVDAVSGEAVAAPAWDDAYVYDDLDGVENADMIEALGLAGVGFAGGSFLPEQELTERDAVLLLLRAGGSYVRDEEDESLAEQARYQGFITGDWQPDGTVSRMAFLRMLLTPSRYGYAAALTGVWDEGFTDVDEADAPYAAIARALGLADGDTLAPDETLTRADAAALLGRFMQR